MKAFSKIFSGGDKAPAAAAAAANADDKLRRAQSSTALPSPAPGTAAAIGATARPVVGGNLAATLGIAAVPPSNKHLATAAAGQPSRGAAPPVGRSVSASAAAVSGATAQAAMGLSASQSSDQAAAAPPADDDSGLFADLEVKEDLPPAPAGPALDAPAPAAGGGDSAFSFLHNHQGSLAPLGVGGGGRPVRRGLTATCLAAPIRWGPQASRRRQPRRWTPASHGSPRTMATPAGQRQRAARNRGSSRRSSPRPCRSSAKPRAPLQSRPPWEEASQTIGRQRVRRRPRLAAAPRCPLRPPRCRTVLGPLPRPCPRPSRPPARRRQRPPRPRPATTRHRNLRRPSPKRAPSRCSRNSKPLGRRSTTTWSASCCGWKPRTVPWPRCGAPSAGWARMLPTRRPFLTRQPSRLAPFPPP